MYISKSDQLQWKVKHVIKLILGDYFDEKNKSIIHVIKNSHH